MKLKVLMFGWEFPPHNSGGLGTACLGICKAMTRQNVDLTFVLPRKKEIIQSDYTVTFADIPNLKIKTINSPIYPYITAGSYKKENESNYGPTLFDEVNAYGEKAKDLANSSNFDVIHAHDWLSFPAGIEAKRKSGKPLVAHVHATEFDRTGGNEINQEVYNIEREGMEKSDGIIAVSDWTKKIIVKHYGINPEKIKVVHNGIDTSEINTLPSILTSLKKKNKKIVLFVGRITLQKGPDYFLEAASKVLNRRKDVYFIMAGSGDMEKSIIKKTASCGISDRVLFSGFLRGDELNQLYQAADLFVLPSVSEPFGLTPLEAIANGTPVLLSKQSGVSETINHALKVDFWDTDEMAGKIITFLDNPSLAKTLIEGGKKDVSKLTWDESVSRYVDYYKNILGGLVNV